MTRPIIYELPEEIQQKLQVLERLARLDENEFLSNPENYLSRLDDFREFSRQALAFLDEQT